MRRGVRGLLSSLSVRLVAYLLIAMTVVLIAFGVLTHNTASARWTETINRFATRTGELIKRATTYGMMLNRKEDVHQIIRFVADAPGVAGIRIYDKQGIIVFSADDREIGTRVDLRAEACVICHDQEKPLQSPSLSDRMRVYRAPSGERLLGVIDPIANSAQCSSAACHAHPSGQSILGVLDVRMSLAGVDEALAATRSQWIGLAAIMLLLVGGITVLLVVHLVRRPVLKLWEGTRRVAQGDLSTRIDIDSTDELGALSRAFNRMTTDLQTARTELTGWSLKLEREVAQKTDELRQVQRQILHMEKMASLGKLSATVAHEINNPLAGVLTYAKLVERTLRDGVPPEEEMEEVRRYLAVIQKETLRCGDIVRNLLVFARQSGAALAPVRIKEITERAMLLIRHHAEMTGVALTCEAGAIDDVVVCDADQIQQTLLALLMNAVEAMSGRGEGKLTVTLIDEGDILRVDVSDTGAGIPDEVLPHIFEPFFSTKNKESGVGLGLAVVYGIVHRHGGSIGIETKVGQGTTFQVRLPRQPPPAASDAAGAQAPTDAARPRNSAEG